MKKPYLLVVLSSPSGGGKTSICKMLLRRHGEYCRSISLTTRSKRPQEKDGVDYYFVTAQEFQKKKAKGELIESAKVFGNWYATPKEFVRRAKREGKTCIFVLDVQGGTQLKRQYPESVLIFVLPPSLSELKTRLFKRGTDDKQTLEQRLKVALKEVKFWSKYDYVVINRSLKETVDLVDCIIISERHRCPRLKKDRWDRIAKSI